MMRRTLAIAVALLLLSSCRSLAWSEFIVPCGSSLRQTCGQKRPCTHYNLCGFAADGTTWVCEQQANCAEDLKPFDQPPTKSKEVIK